MHRYLSLINPISCPVSFNHCLLENLMVSFNNLSNVHLKGKIKADSKSGQTTGLGDRQKSNFYTSTLEY